MALDIFLVRCPHECPLPMVSWLLSAAALGEHAGHERLAKLIEKRLAHEHEGVRRAALIAVSWLEWPDFRATVERMAMTDPEEEVRSYAANLAKAYVLREEGKI